MTGSPLVLCGPLPTERHVRVRIRYLPPALLGLGAVASAQAQIPAGQPVPPAQILPAAQPQFPVGTRFLRIIATNDFHGALEPRPDANGIRRGGAAYVAAAIDRPPAECAPRSETLLLDAGDLFQGPPASNLSYGRPVVEYYNRMGYAAAAL